MKVEKKVLEPVPPPVEYVITLSSEEAVHILRIAGGSTGSAPEKATLWKLYDALLASGIDASHPTYFGMKEIRIERKP